MRFTLTTQEYARSNWTKHVGLMSERTVNDLAWPLKYNDNGFLTTHCPPPPSLIMDYRHQRVITNRLFASYDIPFGLKASPLSYNYSHYLPNMPINNQSPLVA